MEKLISAEKALAKFEEILADSAKDDLTSHTYHEGVAEQIYQHLPNYAKAFRELVSQVRQLN